MWHNAVKRGERLVITINLNSSIDWHKTYYNNQSPQWLNNSESSALQTSKQVNFCVVSKQMSYLPNHEKERDWKKFIYKNICKYLKKISLFSSKKIQMNKKKMYFKFRNER